jgi:hypothetical protein
MNAASKVKGYVIKYSFSVRGILWKRLMVL